MKGFFKAGPKGPILNEVVFNQNRFKYSQHTNSRMVFFPTSATSQMTDIIMNPKTHCFSVGPKGCGKSYAIALNAMLNQKIIAAIINSY